MTGARRDATVSQVEFPCLLMPGRYTFTGRFLLRPLSCTEGTECPRLHPLPEISFPHCLLESVEAQYVDPHAWLRYSCVIRAEQPVVLKLTLQEVGGLQFREIGVEQAELTWSPFEQLQQTRQALSAALSAVSADTE